MILKELFYVSENAMHKDVILWYQQPKRVEIEQSVTGTGAQSVYVTEVQLVWILNHSVACYSFLCSTLYLLNAIPMAKTKKTAREYKQEEIGKELKMFHYEKNQQIKTQKCRKWLK